MLEKRKVRLKLKKKLLWPDFVRKMKKDREKK